MKDARREALERLEVFRRLRRAVLQFRRDLFDDDWLAGPERARCRAVHRHHRRVAAQRLGQRGPLADRR